MRGHLSAGPSTDQKVGGFESLGTGATFASPRWGGCGSGGCATGAEGDGCSDCGCRVTHNCETASGKLWLHCGGQTPFQIIGIGSQNTHLAEGTDAVQALQSAMILIGANLNHLNNELGGRLKWNGDDSGELGFP